MPDELLPPPTGTTPLLPPSLNPEQQDLCNRLDEWHDQYKSLKGKPSKMFQGAIFAIKTECRNNPDMIAQAAHSLREILYPFKSKEEAIREYGSVHRQSLYRENRASIWSTK